MNRLLIALLSSLYLLIGAPARATEGPYRIILPHLEKARNQKIGICWYHSFVRGTEYAYRRLTGERVLLSPQYLSANYLRTKALEALDDPTLPLKVVTHDSWGPPTEMQKRYGLMTSTNRLTDRSLIRLRMDAVKLVEAFRADVQRKGSAAPELVEAYREKVNRLIDEAGASPRQNFSVGGREYTPMSFAQAAPFDRLRWVVVQVADRRRYLPDAPTVDSYQDVVNLARRYEGQPFDVPLQHMPGKRAMRYLLPADPARPETDSLVVPNAGRFSDYLGFVEKNKRSLELIIRDALSTGMPVRTASLILDYYQGDKAQIAVKPGQPVPTAPWSYANTHGMVIVGIERSPSGEVTLTLQNSWGRTAKGRAGLLTMSLADFERLGREITVPVVF